MIHLRDPIGQAITGLPKLDSDFSPSVSLSAVPDAITLAAVPDTTLCRLMADATMDSDGADSMLAAAYLMGDLASALTDIVAGLALRGQWLVAARASAVSIIPRFVHWTEDDEAGVSLAFDLQLDTQGLAFYPTPSPYGFAKSLEAIFAPVIDQLFHASRLSRSALWRLVGDALAYSFLAHGRLLNDPQSAMDHAIAILREPDTKLRNKQVRFDLITLPEAPDLGDYLRVRGGCCRAYTRPGKPDYCTTCVLRDDDSRNERYRNYLRRTRLDAPIETT